MEKFIAALTLRNWNVVHEAMKKEASRQVVEMVTWLKRMEEHDPEGLETLSEGVGVDLAGAVKKAEKYRFKIYNRNKDIKSIIVKAESASPEKIAELAALKSEYESEQFMVFGKILKIYCILSTVTTLTLPEEDDDPYAERELYHPTS